MISVRLRHATESSNELLGGFVEKVYFPAFLREVTLTASELAYFSGAVRYELLRTPETSPELIRNIGWRFGAQLEALILPSDAYWPATNLDLRSVIPFLPSVLGDSVLINFRSVDNSLGTVQAHLQEGTFEAALQELSEREALILRLRYGLEDGVRHTKAETARRVGLSPTRCSELETAANTTLHHYGLRLRKVS